MQKVSFRLSQERGLLCAGATAKKVSFNITQKRGLSLVGGPEVFTADGVLTPAEAAQLVLAAEAQGFQLQDSRGAAHGEVSPAVTLALYAAGSSTNK